MSETGRFVVAGIAIVFVILYTSYFMWAALKERRRWKSWNVFTQTQRAALCERVRLALVVFVDDQRGKKLYQKLNWRDNDHWELDVERHPWKLVLVPLVDREGRVLWDLVSVVLSSADGQRVVRMPLRNPWTDFEDQIALVLKPHELRYLAAKNRIRNLVYAEELVKRAADQHQQIVSNEML